MPIADTLSRDCSNEPSDEEELSFSVNLIVVMSKERLKEAKLLTDDENELNMLKNIIMIGWLEDKNNIIHNVFKYWNHRDKLAVYDDLIFKGQRLLVPTPSSLRPLPFS